MIRRHDLADSVFLALAADERFAAVGYLEVEGNRIGSGVLIGARSVLTAAHVLSGNAFHQDIRFVVEVEPLDQVRRSVVDIVVHDDAGLSLLEGRIDLAILTLDLPVERVEAAVIDSRPPEIGSPATMVGYGVSQSALGSGLADAAPRRRAGENAIDIYGPGPDGVGLPGLLASDLDHPTDTSPNVIGDAEPLAFESIPTGGDSGGGLFVGRGSDRLLAGIATTVRIRTSSETGLYGSVAFWVRLSDHIAWIHSNVPDLETRPAG